MKKLVVCILGFATLAFSVCSARAPVSQGASKQIEKPAKISSWLAIVSSESGSLRYAKEGKYVLEINVTDSNKKLILLTDKLGHQVRFVSAVRLKKLWRKGFNDSYSVPPNAVLSSTQLGSVVIEILQVTMKGSKILFVVKPLQSNTLGLFKTKVPLKKIVLTIDDSSAYTSLKQCNINCGHTCELRLCTDYYICGINPN